MNSFSFNVFLKPKKMKVGLVGILQNPSVRMSSHNAGWTHVYLSMLQAKHDDVEVINDSCNWNEYDVIYINEGVNFKEGVWNLFGGVSDKLIKKLAQLNNFKGSIFFWGDFTPNYNELIEKRKISNHLLGDNYNIPSLKINVLPSINNSNKLVLGDSHTISVYNSGYDIKRMDGKTLNGILKEGLINHIKPHQNLIRLYAGNIDVRHHICRLYKEDERTLQCDRLISELEIKALESSNISFEIVKLLPIENETRKIPKTGYYDNKPFWGSWRERTDISRYINNELHKMCLRLRIELLEWNSLTNNDQELDFKNMEAKQSVHLAPSSYMFDFIIKKDKNNLTLF
jgi:hypothetical protein